MRVAIVTPYHRESADVLRRCCDSVRDQTHSNVRHLMISDGSPHPVLNHRDLDHYCLPLSHADAGATPRALGAISAFSQGYDAVGFLDADCYLRLNHVQHMIAVLNHSSADAVIATRVIHSEDDREMYVDHIESNGINMVDTNSWFITRRCLHLLTAWITEPSQRLWSDRHFSAAVLHSGLGLVRSQDPTVVYVTRWAWHYQQAGWPIPDHAVWISHTADGSLCHVSHANK